MIPNEYVCVPRAVASAWWPKPYSEIRAAAVAGVDGISLVVAPKLRVPDPKKTAEGAMREVDHYPYTVRGQMVFREGGISDGYDRNDVASLHSQGY